MPKAKEVLDLRAIDTWSGPWDAFVQKHRAWWDRVSKLGPVYALPTQVIEALAREDRSADPRHRSSKALISAEDAEAERDFLEVCKGFSRMTVGVWDGRPIRYDLLGEGDVRLDISDRTMAELGWTSLGSPDHFRSVIDDAREPRARADHQLVGYVGKLTVDAQYLRDQAELQARWNALPDRPPLPLNANVADQPPTPTVFIDPGIDRVLGGELERFLIDFGRFMRKWRLNQMVTWDLPLPQGPMEEAPLGLQAAVLGADTPATTIPSFYDLPSDVDVRGRIREQQRQAGIADGIETEHPVTDTSDRDGHASRYESAFRMWLIEQAVRSRYGEPRGLVTRLNRGFADHWEISEDRVQKLRQIYVKNIKKNI